MTECTLTLFYSCLQSWGRQCLTQWEYGKGWQTAVFKQLRIQHLMKLRWGNGVGALICSAHKVDELLDQCTMRTTWMVADRGLLCQCVMLRVHYTHAVQQQTLQHCTTIKDSVDGHGEIYGQQSITPWEEWFSVVMLQSLHLTPRTCANMCQIKKILQHHEKRLVKARPRCVSGGIDHCYDCRVQNQRPMRGRAALELLELSSLGFA